LFAAGSSGCLQVASVVYCVKLIFEIFVSGTLLVDKGLDIALEEG